MRTRRHKFKHNKPKGRNDYYSTFDPKVHHRSKGSTGYGLKRGVATDPAEDRGSALAHLFDKWKS